METCGVYQVWGCGASGSTSSPVRSLHSCGRRGVAAAGDAEGLGRARHGTEVHPLRHIIHGTWQAGTAA